MQSTDKNVFELLPILVWWRFTCLSFWAPLNTIKLMIWDAYGKFGDPCPRWAYINMFDIVRSNLFRFHGLLTVLTVLILHVYDFAFTRQVATIIDHDHVHHFLHPVTLDLFDLFDLYINKGLRGFRAIQANALNRQSTGSFPLLWLLQRNGSQLRVFGRWIPSPKRDLQLLLVSFVGSMMVDARKNPLVLSPVLWGQKQSTSITYTIHHYPTLLVGIQPQEIYQSKAGKFWCWRAEKRTMPKHLQSFAGSRSFLVCHRPHKPPGDLQPHWFAAAIESLEAWKSEASRDVLPCANCTSHLDALGRSSAMPSPETSRRLGWGTTTR